jgi:hypothetical protein
MNVKSKPKIQLDSIERAHRALDALPEHRPEHLSKMQAIQKLIGPIRSTQSKGYSLEAIGKVLSECGIPITTGALRAYVSEATANDGGRKKPKAKQVVKAAKETQQGAARSTKEPAAMQPAKPGTKPRAPGATGNVDLDWEAEAPRERLSPSSGRLLRSS